MDFEIVYPLYHELNEIIQSTKTSKTTEIKIRAASRDHGDVIYLCEFQVEH